MTIQITSVATFALTREKNTKKVVMKPYMFTGKLLQPSNKVLREFVAANVAMILNMSEEIPGVSQGSKPALYVQDAKRRSRRRAYVLDFWKTDRKITLRNILGAPEIPFLNLSKTIAEWLKDADFWPITYLFIVQFKVPEVKSSKGFVAMLLTRLSHGKLAEHERAILQQIEEGVIDPSIKKGHLFPHIISRGGQLSTEDTVKSFEDQLVPANYFYDFLHLQPPFYAQNLAEDTYKNFKAKGKIPPFSQLKESLQKLRSEIPELAKATIELDTIEVKLPLSALNDTVKLAKDDKGFVVLATGSQMKLKLGKYDLLADGVYGTNDTGKILDEIKRRNTNG